jgi:minimal PKS chain-length factor (CLF/KS beta)
MACQFGHGMLSRQSDPTLAYLPFTTRASGFVPAEGGAFVLLEEERAARHRGARVRALVAGHGATFTGSYRLERSAEGLLRAARAALVEADLDVSDIDVVFADALGTPEGDAAEAEALARLFDDRLGAVPIAVPKAGTGRAYAGAAAIDVVSATLSIEEGIIPSAPDIGETTYGLDVVRGGPRRRDLRTALILARGMYGGNSALVIRRDRQVG